MTQLALDKTEMVDMLRVFFPFATDATGQTLSEKRVEGRFVLGDGKESHSSPHPERRIPTCNHFDQSENVDDAY